MSRAVYNYPPRAVNLGAACFTPEVQQRRTTRHSGLF